MPMHGGRTRERDDMKEVSYIKKFSRQGHLLQRKDKANKFLKIKKKLCSHRLRKKVSEYLCDRKERKRVKERKVCV